MDMILLSRLIRWTVLYCRQITLLVKVAEIIFHQKLFLSAIIEGNNSSVR